MSLDYWAQLFSKQMLGLDEIQPDEVYYDFDIERNFDFSQLGDGKPPRRAAVLVPLIERDDGLKLILTKRTDHMPTHAGQIAFPGGGMNKEDKNLVETAIREAFEEVGLDPKYVNPIGAGDNYLTGSNFLITPIVAIIDKDAVFNADPYEVAEIFELPVKEIFNLDNQQIHSRIFNEVKRSYYAIECEGYYVWGVTAALINAMTYRLNGQPLVSHDAVK